MTYPSSIKALIKYHSDAPNVDFGTDFGRLMGDDETFGWKVPKMKRKSIWNTIGTRKSSPACENAHNEEAT